MKITLILAEIILILSWAFIITVSIVRNNKRINEMRRKGYNLFLREVSIFLKGLTLISKSYYHMSNTHFAETKNGKEISELNDILICPEFTDNIIKEYGEKFLSKNKAKLEKQIKKDLKGHRKLILFPNTQNAITDRIQYLEDLIDGKKSY